MIELPPKIDTRVFIEALTKEVPENIRSIVDKINNDYAYWDKVKYQPLPEGCTPQILWTYVKASRLRGMVNVWNKYGIKF